MKTKHVSSVRVWLWYLSDMFSIQLLRTLPYFKELHFTRFNCIEYFITGMPQSHYGWYFL